MKCLIEHNADGTTTVWHHVSRAHVPTARQILVSMTLAEYRASMALDGITTTVRQRYANAVVLNSTYNAHSKNGVAQ